MNVIEIRNSKIPLFAFGFLAIFFVPMGLGLLYSGISRKFTPMPIVIGGSCLLLFSVFSIMIIRSYIKSAKRFDDRGLKRGDGRELVWTDLSKVVHQMHYNRTLHREVLWRTEIHFRDGQVAWLIPTKVANWDEVSEYVARLQCPQEEIKV